MAWLAATFHDQLSAGTELAIFQEPWDPQTDLPDQLPASVDLGIDFPDGAAAVVLVRDVIGSEAVIQTSDQIKWRMVLIDLKELKYPPRRPKMPLAPIGELRSGLHNEPSAFVFRSLVRTQSPSGNNRLCSLNQPSDHPRQPLCY